MARTDDERKVRLRPRKPPEARCERAVWASGFKLLMHYARSSRKGRNRRASGGKRGNRRPYQQRCAVRVTFLKNKTRGQWKAHGRYLTRESATREESVDIAARLDEWQKADDERLWKLIISPEFGDRVDLKRLTRDLMERMEKDLGTGLEWAAVEHYNTEHPHVHVVVRGLRGDGTALRMSRDYIQQGIRSIAEHLCTCQLGYRTELDAMESERREITETRFTSLDRRIMRDASSPSADFEIVRNPAEPCLSEMDRIRTKHEASRLAVLERMGLAQSTGGSSWLVRRDFEQVLRAMQRSGDRQKTLASHGALMSDERLPMTTLDMKDLTCVEGRILLHGEDEFSGRSYMMLEGTDAHVYYVYRTPEMEEMRSRGELKTNSFIRLRKRATVGNPVMEIVDLGDSETILRDKVHFRERARGMMKRALVPQDDGWKGWLGRYQKALVEAARSLEQQQRERERHKRRDFGR